QCMAEYDYEGATTLVIISVDRTTAFRAYPKCLEISTTDLSHLDLHRLGPGGVGQRREHLAPNPGKSVAGRNDVSQVKRRLVRAESHQTIWLLITERAQ